MDDHHSSILFRQGGIGARTGNIGGFDEMENSRRITSNFLFNNTSSSYDFGLMAQAGIDQPEDSVNVSNNNFTFIQTAQRTKYELTNLVSDITKSQFEQLVFSCMSSSSHCSLFHI